jgi:hypothetical protein
MVEEEDHHEVLQEGWWKMVQVERAVAGEIRLLMVTILRTGLLWDPKGRRSTYRTVSDKVLPFSPYQRYTVQLPTNWKEILCPVAKANQNCYTCFLLKYGNSIAHSLVFLLPNYPVGQPRHKRQ